MSNKSVIERLLAEIDEYDKNRRDRDAFAQRVYESEIQEVIPKLKEWVNELIQAHS